jgi:hypothetical protein
MRILYKFLPETCDHLEHCITPVAYTPLNAHHQTAIDLKNQRDNIIRQAKRTWLHHILHAYESDIRDDERHYQTEYDVLEVSFSTPTWTHDDISAWQSTRDYLVEQTNQWRESIREEVSSSRRRLLQNRQRTSSSSSSSWKDTIGVSPQPYLDLIFNPFNHREWHYLCLGKPYSRPVVMRTSVCVCVCPLVIGDHCPV